MSPKLVSNTSSRRESSTAQSIDSNGVTHTGQPGPWISRTTPSNAYGSGAAAEAIPVKVLPGWEAAAAKIQFAQALENTIDLTEPQYLALRDRADTDDLGFPASNECIVTHVGHSKEAGFQDVGIEYYRYVSS